MGSGITSFCIDIEELRALHGSGDMRIIDRIEESEYLDDNWSEADEDVPDAPTTRTAAIAILNGKHPSNAADFSAQYLWAMEWICRVLDDPLPNADEFEKFYDFDVVDKVLGKIGVREGCRMADMVDKRGLLPIPGYGDKNQGVGFLTSEDVRQAWSVLKSPNLLGVDPMNARNVLMFRSWLEKAASVNKGLVGFYPV